MADQNDSQEAVLTGPDLIRAMGLWKVLREDYKTHQRAWTQAGLQTLFIYRVGTWALTLPPIVRSPVRLFYELGFRFCRNFYGIELELTVRVGRRFRLGHQHGIVIHRHATFGDDCIVRHGVTFGKKIGEWIEGVGPVIGNKVNFSSGVVVLGNIKIGDRVEIGPNCIIADDVPSDQILSVSPPQMLPRAQERAQEFKEVS